MDGGSWALWNKFATEAEKTAKILWNDCIIRQVMESFGSWFLMIGWKGHTIEALFLVMPDGLTWIYYKDVLSLVIGRDMMIKGMYYIIALIWYYF